MSRDCTQCPSNQPAGVAEEEAFSWEMRVTKTFLDRKVQLMTQIVFVNIIEICFLMTYVVLTVTCRHEFYDAKSYGLVWLFILIYFLFYVRTGFTFVLEFQQLVQDCEVYLTPTDEKTAQRLLQIPEIMNMKREAMRKLKLQSDSYVIHWMPAIIMLLLAEFVNFSKWKGNCYWYMPLLVLNGVTVCYHTFKLKRYYTQPTSIEVYSIKFGLKS